MARPALHQVLRLVTAGVMVLIFIAAATGASIKFAQRELRDEALAHDLKANGERARSASIALSHMLADNLRVVRAYAKRPAVVQAATTRAWPKIQALMPSLAVARPSFGAAAFYGPDGRLRARTPAQRKFVGFAFKKQDYFRKPLGATGSFVSGLYKQRLAPAGFAIVTSAAVRTPKRRLLGVLLTSSPLSKLDAALRATVPAIGSLQVFDPEGHRILPAKNVSEATFKGNDIVGRALAGETGSQTGRVSTLPGEQLIAFAPAEPGFAVVVERPALPPDKALDRIRTRLIVVGAILGALVLLAITSGYASDAGRASAPPA